MNHTYIVYLLIVFVMQNRTILLVENELRVAYDDLCGSRTI